MRDVFRDTANIIDEMLSLEERKDKGEEVTKEYESICGRFIIKMMTLEELSK